MVNYILLAIPAFLLLIGIEILLGYLKGKKYYRFADAITNLSIGVGNQVLGILYKGLIVVSMFYIAENFAIFKIPASSVWGWIGCFLLFDMLFYWAHRWSHEINFFWGAHVVHHQSEEYNLTVALRQSWFHNLIMFFLFIPIPLLGFDATVFFVVLAFSSIYQFWIHTKAIGKLPKIIEFIFNTPSHHRVHHAVNEEYLDKNHAAVLIIWDRLFGTFKEEEYEPTYGTTTQFKSFNPVWANFEYYHTLGQLAKKMNFADKIKLFFARPGWLPEYLGGFQNPEPFKDGRKPYKTKISKLGYVYVGIQFAIVIWALIAYLSNFDTLSGFYKIFFAALILLSITICGGIIEKKKWLMFSEYFRLTMVGVAVNYYYYMTYQDWFMAMLTFSIVCYIAFNIFWSILMVKETKTEMALN
jgi:alkylglycerol monooxygenase